MATAYIAIGTNLGNRLGHLDFARRSLSTLPRTTLISMSAPFETDPVGPVEMGMFLNAAARIETDLSPRDLLAELANIEREAGRTPKSQRTRWGPRELDLDIALYGDRIINERDLQVPHPRMHERLFVLEPLAAIGPYAMHPVLKKHVRELLADLNEASGAG